MRIILECDITYKYTYDNYGNILSKSTYKLNTTTLINTDTYTYDNANYKDQLTKFNNDTITYDGISNPLKIGNTIYNWSNGRELQSISNTNLNVSYKYDRNGIRTKKILNNEEISYVLENTSIVIEKHKDYMLYFLRDDSNNLLGFTYKNKTYYYKKNAFDDIIGIYDSNYKEVCTYSYDAYGNILSIKDNTGKDITDTSNVALINPFRYRSYYYDTETNLYYLNSRYYSPKMGRFINCDGFIGSSETVAGYNLYTYCSNNPVGKLDKYGNMAEMAGCLYGGLELSLGGALGATIALYGLGVAVTYGIYKAAKSIADTKVTTSSDIKEKKKESCEGNNNVYILVDKSGSVQYVGRTTNPSARGRQHRHTEAKETLTMFPVASNICYEKARGLEQELILKYHTFDNTPGNYRNNRINGISPHNKKKDIYMNSFDLNDYWNDLIIYRDRYGEEIKVGKIEW